ncbi:MAG: LytTR family DNA-binding domain-containing protein [Bacteroidota bacterium]
MAILKRVVIHILFWLVSTLFVWHFIGSRSPDKSLVLIFLMLLMPITIFTSYTLNYYLIANKLLKGKYVDFVIYGLFVFIASIYLQGMIIMFSFPLYADYKFDNVGPILGNISFLAIATYFVVFLSAILFLLRRRMFHTNRSVPETEPERTKILQVTSNRKTVNIELDNILYVESLSNYVKIHTPEETVITKEKISKLEERLPENFLRVHRSFLVNQNHVEAFGKESLTINQVKLNISRTYKNSVFQKLSEMQMM